ncbi:MAG: VCBS repeat-containing protein [Planctomycetota bacterium]|nr:VCBS repeat-containing protein [Planctomycetota bacterium]
MDLNGDGRKDILTGSYTPGDLYLFARKEDGSFAKGEILKDKDGKNIAVGRATTPYAVDWDGDGDLDLLVGDIQGYAWLVANESGGAELKFAAPTKLQHDGKDIKADHGDSQVVIVDWNGDGTHDLLLAHGSGAVSLYAGIAGKGAPKLSAPVTLVEKPGAAKEGEVLPGSRAKVCVSDVDGDGALDLLLGDFGYIMHPQPELTEAEQKEYAELQEKQKETTAKFSEVISRVQKAVEKEFGKERKDLATKEEQQKFAEAFSKALRADEEYLAVSKENSELYQKMAKYQPKREYRGNVWLYKAKKAEKEPATGN